MDTLCIVQDSEADKAHEIGSMARVYGNAHLTIVASNARSASEGFLGPRELHDPQRPTSDLLNGVRVPFRVSKYCFGSVAVEDLSSTYHGLVSFKEPIDERAWTLQEQLISKRLLLYKSYTLQWRCPAGTMSLGQSLHVEPVHAPPAKMVSQLNTDPKQACAEWLRLVEIYSSRVASFQKDKLPAIAALAEKFAPVLGQYLAGIWSHDISSQLDWQEWRYPILNIGSSLYRAPSWSWASTDVEIKYKSIKEETRVPRCSFVSANISLKDSKLPYGEVLRGSVTIRDQLLFGRSGTSSDGYGRAEAIHVCADQYIQESPAMRYFKTYFKETLPSSSRSRTWSTHTDFRFDSGRDVLFPGAFCKS